MNTPFVQLGFWDFSKGWEGKAKAQGENKKAPKAKEGKPWGLRGNAALGSADDVAVVSRYQCSDLFLFREEEIKMK
jgi:hypothetical protein